MTRRICLSVLICVNLVLLLGVCLASYSLPQAHAQPATGLSGNYLIVTGEIQNEYDAMYLLDQQERTLHAFYWEKGRRQLIYSDWRDLERDFRNNRD
jgi:hypothetical protein